MHATADMGPRPRRRPKTWKIVLLCVVFLALLEPLVMYRLLERQKAHRQEARNPVELISARGTGK